MSRSTNPIQGRTGIAAILLVAGVVLGGWLLLERESDREPPPRAGDREDSAATAVSPESGRAPPDLATRAIVTDAFEPAPDPDQIRVISAAGLPIEEVEWSSDGGFPWRLVAPDRVPPEAGWVRAAGHLAARVPAGSNRILLEVDAMVILRCEGLGDGITNIEISDGFGRGGSHRRRAALTRALDANRFALALSVERWTRREPEVEVELELTLAGGPALVLEWKPKSGERHELQLDLEADWLGATLEPVSFLEHGAPENEEVVRVVTFSIIPDSQSRRSWSSGGVHVRLKFGARQWRVGFRDDPFEIDDLPRGVRLLASWRRTDGWYARRVFRNESAAVDIDLRPPSRLLARLVDPDGAPLSGVTASIQFQGHEPERRLARRWNTGRSMYSDEEGLLSETMPRRVPTTIPGEGLPEEIPERARLTLEKKGFSTTRRELTLAPGSTVDLGRIVLEPRAPTFIVRSEAEWPRHRIFSVRWVDKGQERVAQIETARRLEPGVLALTCRNPEAEPKERPAAIVLEHSGGFTGALLEGSSYRAQPSRRFTVAVDPSWLEPRPEYLRLLVRWRGITFQVWAVRKSRMDRSDHRFSGHYPATGATLHWEERVARKKGKIRSLGPLETHSARLQLSR